MGLCLIILSNRPLWVSLLLVGGQSRGLNCCWVPPSSWYTVGSWARPLLVVFWLSRFAFAAQDGAFHLVVCRFLAVETWFLLVTTCVSIRPHILVVCLLCWPRVAPLFSSSLSCVFAGWTHTPIWYGPVRGQPVAFPLGAHSVPQFGRCWPNVSSCTVSPCLVPLKGTNLPYGWNKRYASEEYSQTFSGLRRGWAKDKKNCFLLQL